MSLRHCHHGLGEMLNIGEGSIARGAGGRSGIGAMTAGTSLESAVLAAPLSFTRAFESRRLPYLLLRIS